MGKLSLRKVDPPGDPLVSHLSKEELLSLAVQKKMTSVKLNTACGRRD